MATLARGSSSGRAAGGESRGRTATDELFWANAGIPSRHATSPADPATHGSSNVPEELGRGGPTVMIACATPSALELADTVYSP